MKPESLRRLRMALNADSYAYSYKQKNGHSDFIIHTNYIMQVLLLHQGLSRYIRALSKIRFYLLQDGCMCVCILYIYTCK